MELQTFRSLKDNKSLRDQAQAMFLSGEFYPTEIAQYLSVDINELGHYVFGDNRQGTTKTCWHYQKENNKAPVNIANYEKIKPMYIKKTEKRLLDVTNKLIKKLDNDTRIDEMDTRDLINLINSMEKVDRIGRLEEDKPTQNIVTERKTFTLRDIISNSEVQDAKYRTVSNPLSIDAVTGKSANKKEDGKENEEDTSPLQGKI